MNGLDAILNFYGQEEFYKDFLIELLSELIDDLSSKAIQAYLCIKDFYMQIGVILKKLLI